MRVGRPKASVVVIGFACGALALGAGAAARAESPHQSDAWAQIVPRESAPADDVEDQPSVPPDPAALQTEPDWSELGKFPDLPSRTLRADAPRSKPAQSSVWSRSDRADGSSALAVKSEVSPFLDTRVGADLSVARPGMPATIADRLAEQMRSGEVTTTSSGTAWAAMTGPGVPYLWDRTGLDVSMDSRTDRSKFGTTLSKSVPIADNQYALTLQNAYRLTQPAPAPLTGSNSPENRTVEIEGSARLSAKQTGTSLVAGQTLSSTDDKWLGHVGAEQKLPGDVTVTGTVNETLHGPASKSLTAGFKKSW